MKRMPSSARPAPRRARSRGGFTIGLVVGLLIGLAAALGVALYVTKAPNPFVNKVPQRPAGSDQVEAERNRTWDPNASLASRAPLPAPAAAVASAPPPQLVPPTVTDPFVAPPAVAASVPGRRASSPRDAAVERALAQAQAEGRDPPPGLPVAPGSGSDPFVYFVQAGAFARSEDAEQQRAKLAMAGVESKLFERDQAGRTVWRVRVGPFNRKDDADAAKEKLGQSGVDAALVRVQR